jgi:hypothetical protein
MAQRETQGAAIEGIVQTMLGRDALPQEAGKIRPGSSLWGLLPASIPLAPGKKLLSLDVRNGLIQFPE